MGTTEPIMSTTEEIMAATEQLMEGTEGYRGSVVLLRQSALRLLSIEIMNFLAAKS